MTALRGAQFAFSHNVLNRFVVTASNSVADFTPRLRQRRQHDVSPAPSRLPIEEHLTDFKAFTHRLSLRRAGRLPRLHSIGRWPDATSNSPNPRKISERGATRSGGLAY